MRYHYNESKYCFQIYSNSCYLALQITVRNDSDEPRTVIAALTARAIYYTGVNHTIIKKAEGQIKLGPSEYALY